MARLILIIVLLATAVPAAYASKPFTAGTWYIANGLNIECENVTTDPGKPQWDCVQAWNDARQWVEDRKNDCLQADPRINFCISVEPPFQNTPQYVATGTVHGYENVWCEDGLELNEALFECLPPPLTPDDCREQDLYYDGTQPQGSECVAECPFGELDSICLQEPERENECSTDSDDYIGKVGWGQKQQLVCGDNECAEGGTFGFKENGNGDLIAQCFPPDANAPQCPTGSALVVGESGYAFQCENITRDEPDGGDESDGDSDGDGEGDVTGITGQLEDIKGLLRSGNTERTNIKGKLDQINKTIGDGVNTLKDAISNIPGDGGNGGNGGDGDGGDGGDGEGEGEDPITWTGEPIDTELTAADEEYEAVMQEYQDTLNNLKNEVQNMFGANLSGGGSVPDDVKQIKGVDVNFSLDLFLGGFEILPALILFIAAFISLGIITSGRG